MTRTEAICLFTHKLVYEPITTNEEEQAINLAIESLSQHPMAINNGVTSEELTNIYNNCNYQYSPGKESNIVVMIRQVELLLDKKGLLIKKIKRWKWTDGKTITIDPYSEDEFVAAFPTGKFGWYKVEGSDKE